ncbi:hypothetical protein ABTL30_20105, partial [Acinetobacter baumannii]
MGCGPERAAAALAGEGTIVAGVATHRAHGGVRHGVSRKARRRAGMAMAALHRCAWNVRRRRHAERGRVVV